MWCGAKIAVQVELNLPAIPQQVVSMLAERLKHWKTGQSLTVQGGTETIIY